MQYLLNGQTIFHEKAKSLTQNHFQRSTNDNSDHKKQTLIQQQQLQQLSPEKMKALIQMTKLIKNSSKEQIADPQAISPGQNQQKSLKTRRKKSQGKINVNFHNLNADEISKPQQINANIRSSSQPQVRSQSQQANSQERQILQVKKNSIKNVDSHQFLVKQDPLRIAQLENSIERVGSNQNLHKQGSLKIVLKKNGSMRALPNQQAVKISKDQIMLKNQQNFNSQGSTGQINNNNQRSRSLSNSKFAKKKASPQSQPVDNNQIEEQIITQRLNAKDKNIIGNSFNQGINIMTKQRCKSNNKIQGSTCLEEQQQLAIQASGSGVPLQNSSKLLMFKTNNEESNAKVAALKSIIKLSSSNNTNNYMQNKQGPQRNQSKENQNNQSQNQIQTGIQIKQLVQQMKMQETQNPKTPQ